jgi:PKD repeat protein
LPGNLIDLLGGNYNAYYWKKVVHIGGVVKEASVLVRDNRSHTFSATDCNVPSVGPTITKFEANPTSGNAPFTTTLSWTSTGTTYCTASSGNWSGNQGLNGSKSFVLSSPGVYTYSLTCGSSSATSTDTQTVSVTANPKTVVDTSGDLTVSVKNNGSITSNDGFINCSQTGGVCSHNYASPTQVTLTAVPASTNSTFVGWTGSCSSQTTNVCVVSTGSSAINTTAIFSLRSIIYKEF